VFEWNHPRNAAEQKFGFEPFRMNGLQAIPAAGRLQKLAGKTGLRFVD